MLVILLVRHPVSVQLYERQDAFYANLRRVLVTLDPNDPIVGVQPIVEVTQTVFENFAVPPGTNAPPAPPPFNLLDTINNLPNVTNATFVPPPSPPPPSPPAAPFLTVRNVSVDGAIGKSG